jgi:hypothetical protein
MQKVQPTTRNTANQLVSSLPSEVQSITRRKPTIRKAANSTGEQITTRNAANPTGEELTTRKAANHKQKDQPPEEQPISRKEARRVSNPLKRSQTTEEQPNSRKAASLQKAVNHAV